MQIKTGGLPDRQAVLAEILGAISRNDFAALAIHYTGNAELHISGSGMMDASWKGRERVLAAIVANFDKITEQKSELEAMVQQGDSIVMLIRENGRWKQNDRPYSVRGVIWWTFEGERLARVEQFFRHAE